MGFRALFVGAHPDDIEIAAAGTVARLVQRGADVVAVVATDEEDIEVAEIRRAETRAGLGVLGVGVTNIEFLGLPDRSIDAAVGAQRLMELIGELRFEPDVVVTHSVQDNHPDHRNVATMVGTVFPAQAPILGMTVVNSARSTFCPRFFVDTTEHRAARIAAIHAHSSQRARARIWTDEITALEQANARITGGEFAESFEVTSCERLLDDPVMELFAPCLTPAVDRLRI